MSKAQDARRPLATRGSCLTVPLWLLGEVGLGQFSAARVIRVSKADHVPFNLITEVGGSSSLCGRRWAKGGSRRVRQPRTFVKGRKPQNKGPMRGSS